MNKDKKALYNLMENYFYNCELYGYSTFESWCDDNFENEEQKRLMLEMESWVDNIAWLLFNEDLKEDLSEDNRVYIVYEVDLCKKGGIVEHIEEFDNLEQAEKFRYEYEVEYGLSMDKDVIDEWLEIWRSVYDDGDLIESELAYGVIGYEQTGY